MPTVKQATFDLLRKLGVTTVIGNPGSTEETFLKNFPDDFDYVMALQEASVVGIADGLSQGLRKPVIVNVHTAAGLGNAMGNIVTAYLNKTPLIITAGQQTREMLLMEPFLTNIDATQLPKPWVKWAYQPARAEDVPGAFLRAYAMAIQEPAGPVFLSLPLDDWDKQIAFDTPVRNVSTRKGPDPDSLKIFADKLNHALNPVLIFGGDIARIGQSAWVGGIRFAEKYQAPVWEAPFCERTPFPETHALFAGVLPAAIGPLSGKLDGHDLIVVIGAPVFRYYPYVPGKYLPNEAQLIHVTDDPDQAAKAIVGDSLVCDVGLFLDAVLPLIKPRAIQTKAPFRAAPKTPSNDLPLAPLAVFAALKASSPADIVVSNESPSNTADFQDQFRFDQPDQFFTFASGGLGWNMPASVGLALAEKKTGRNRPVLCVMGDGSYQYSLQSVYTAVQQKLHVVYVVLQNEEYGILKEFAVLEETPNVPGLDLPDIDIVLLAKGYGANAVQVETSDDLARAYQSALDSQAVSVIVVAITQKLGSLIDQTPPTH
jgi:benzoylformate decarboxylase